MYKLAGVVKVFVYLWLHSKTENLRFEFVSGFSATPVRYLSRHAETV
jgi:hypothetical protein